jgi:hypothetical protein
MKKWSQGIFEIKNSEKYVGRKTPRYRSSWEWAFFQFCDNNEHILEWASESISIPYRHPFTGKMTIYIPDVFIRYRTKNNKICSELIEIKPRNQSLIEGKMSEQERMVVAVNHCKWAAAQAWCKKSGIVFRVLNEDHLFHQGKKRK